ncbi:beta-alanine-activating enzyme isoform X2 [Neoarius graeffei]|uniref:beta-alanine-activating enzyme isoform X2 n=1 Tax=Neoarius graeffei TaxID=443677 RepID=UPI00298BFE48|nr:beta-alanine-activating enzyme isoform X2 [Neoarius graeffei]
MKSLHAMVHEAAVHYGTKTAAIFDTGSASPATCLSYDQLVALGNELCRNLQGAVGENEQAIGVFCDVNIFLPVWIFSILQVPAAYVPLDPVSPPLLTMRIMDRCHLKFCLIQSTLLQQFQSAFSTLLSVEVFASWSAHKLTLVKLHKRSLMSPEASNRRPSMEDNPTLKTEQEERQHPSADDPGKEHQAEDLAYVLHTSGTTGLPKIVKVPHKCIVPNIVYLSSLFQMTPDDVVFLASPLTFDPSVVEMFLALSSGACLLMVPSAVKRMPSRLANVLFRRNATTILQATPTLLRRFGGRVLQEEILSAGSSLRVLALGGEVCPSLFVLKSWRQAGNKTHIYNLYGTTEVSCWASCYKLPDNLLSSDHIGCVPLGEPLMDTAVEVRDENGRLVTEGEGQLFIGGQERVCLLDDETMTAARGVMRATGDWVMVQNSHLYYLGRKDCLVKRHGQMLHLDALQQAMESLPQVEAGVVGLHKSSRLVAFVVPKIYTRTLSSEDNGNQEQHVRNSTKDSEDFRVSSRALEMEVLQGLSQLVPNHSIPDTVLLVPALPLTNHGKVAMEKLMKMYERQRDVSGKHTNTVGDMVTIRERLQALWKECLGLCEDGVVADDAHFMLSGGDSLQALRLFDYITITMETASAGLLEVILDGSFSDVLKHITATHQNPVKTSSKRQPEDSVSVVPTKRYHREVDANVDPEGILQPVVSSERSNMRFVVVRRAGDVVFWDYFPDREQRLVTNSKGASDNMGRIQENYQSAERSPLSICKPSMTVTTSSSVRSTDSIHVNRDNPSGDGQSQHSDSGSDITSQVGITKGSQPLCLQVCWSSDTGRCVDASPVLLIGPERATVFIGSHSHRLQALDLSNGEVVWERVLGDRLESSAAVSKCGTLVALGCYDGQVYFLNVDSGETCWVFKTGDAVKSSPAVDPQTGSFIIGSHDGHVYALEPLVKRCVWKYFCGGGAVFSSPCVHSSPRRLYSATLRGQLHCLSPDSGQVLWTYSSNVPFFSSPSCSDSCVCIGSVNGHISALSHDGNVLWDFLTDGPVFSSPCLASLPASTNQRTSSGSYDNCTTLSPACQAVFCGSHDSSVYCINSANGSLLWRFQTTGKVFSSPFVFDGTPWGIRTLVAIASTDGTLWVLDGEQGTLKTSFFLPGELFSSPIVWGHTIVIGCRNDYVYCLELTSKKE